MTSGNMPTRVAMPCPFADEGDVASIGDTTGNTINFKDGFPEVYSTPPSANGKLVQRNEVNALGKVATQNQFYHQCGGINTFDATFAGKISGYPKGSVLKYIDGNNIYDVISLVENNQVNFNTNGIDNINWRIMNKELPSSIDIVEIGTFTINPVATTYNYYQATTNPLSYNWNLSNYFMILRTIKIPCNGILFLERNQYNYTEYSPENPLGYIVNRNMSCSIMNIIGNGLFVKQSPNLSDFTNISAPTSGNLNGWSQVGGIGSSCSGLTVGCDITPGYFPSNVTTTTNWTSSGGSIYVEKDNFLCVALLYGLYSPYFFSTLSTTSTTIRLMPTLITGNITNDIQEAEDASFTLSIQKV